MRAFVTISSAGELACAAGCWAGERAGENAASAAMNNRRMKGGEGVFYIVVGRSPSRKPRLSDETAAARSFRLARLTSQWNVMSNQQIALGVASFAAAIFAASAAQGQTTAAARQPGDTLSAPISNVVYDVTFDRRTAPSRAIGVRMTFTADGSGPVLLSLPAWTPGAYEISNFARWVVGFNATSGATPVSWDKVDYDTWRIRPGAARDISVSFTFTADTLDN